MKSRVGISRRSFLATSGAGAATFCLSGRGPAYAGSEPQSVTAVSQDETVIGGSKWDLDTPALCVDLDRFEQNLATMRKKLAGTGVASRPHAKTHKCPAIAKLQLASGAIGICTAKLSEAEVFAANGVSRILMTTSNVTPGKIRRAMNLRKRDPEFIQAVDLPRNAQDLNDAAREAGIVADVVVDVAVGTRSGTRSPISSCAG
jgi:3-hydroxy-D-aspartate aldolase